MIKEILLTVALTASTFTQDVKQFDEYVNLNYSNLRTSAQNICWGDCDYEDILNNNLIKVRERITKSGFTVTTYTNYDRSIYSYLWRGIDNDFKLKKKREGKRTVIDFDNQDYEQEINRAVNDQEHNSQNYHDNLEIFTRRLFEFLEVNYPEKHSTLFKSYYLLPTHNTYKKLAKESGYTEKYIKDVISNMKKDIKQRLSNYISNEQARNI